MESKKCFACGEEKSLTEFYTHPGMADGRLNKCKSCIKKYTKSRVERLERTDPDWVVKERARHRDKSRKAREDGTASPLLSRKVDPFKKKANIALSNAIRDGILIKKPCEVCGEIKAQGHHEDYDFPLQVNWLCVRHHNDRHIYLRDCKTLKKKPLSIQKWTKVAINK